MTEHHCQGREIAADPIGLAAYTMDSHNTQRFVRDGLAMNEGDVQVGGFPPYPVGYGAITPKQAECENLLVPVCLSASHIAYGSIRMEPVFMVLGQSAATAAVHAIEQKVPVQDVDRTRLRNRLIEDGQVIAWDRPGPRGVDPKSLLGYVIDDRQAEHVGVWKPSTSVGSYVWQGYLHDNQSHRGRKAVGFRTAVPPGRYEVRIAYAPHANRAEQVRVRLENQFIERGTTLKEHTHFRVDQTQEPEIDGLWLSLGEHELLAGFVDPAQVGVQISNTDAYGYVIADAVWFLPVEEQP